jgi:hypothetical protein
MTDRWMDRLKDREKAIKLVVPFVKAIRGLINVGQM